MAGPLHPLTKATRGVLSGVAITLATQGLLTLPAGEGLRTFDAVHLNTSEQIVLSQLHHLGLIDSVHLNFADLVSVVPPYVAPPVPKPIITGGYRPSGAPTYIEYGVPYHYTSNAYFILRSLAEWDYSVQPIQSYRTSSRLDFILASETTAHQKLHASASGHAEFVLIGNSQAKDAPFVVQQSTGRLVTLGEAAYSYFTPNSASLQGRAQFELEGTSDYRFTAAPIPVYVKPNNYSLDTNFVASITGDATYSHHQVETASYSHTATLEAILDGAADYVMNATALNIARFNSQGGSTVVSGNAHVAFTPYVEDHYEEVLLLIAEYMLGDENAS